MFPYYHLIINFQTIVCLGIEALSECVALSLLNTVTQQTPLASGICNYNLEYDQKNKKPSMKVFTCCNGSGFISFWMLMLMMLLQPLSLPFFTFECVSYVLNCLAAIFVQQQAVSSSSSGIQCP